VLEETFSLKPGIGKRMRAFQRGKKKAYDQGENIPVRVGKKREWVIINFITFIILLFVSGLLGRLRQYLKRLGVYGLHKRDSKTIEGL
jgi:hypothetical protein